MTVFGVTSDHWGGDASDIDLSQLPNYDGSTLVKSVLYATAAAVAGTRIEVQSPATAALYYTTWAKWGDAMTAKTMMTNARREVTVGGCGSSSVMFPGGIVVQGPSCVTLRVTSGEGSRYKTVHVPVGRSC